MCSELPGLDLTYAPFAFLVLNDADVIVLCAIELLGKAVAKFDGEVTDRLKGTFVFVFDRFLECRVPVPLALYEFLEMRY